MSGMSTMLRQGPPRRGALTRAPAAGVVPDLICSRHRSASKAARRARRSRRPEDLHRLRIRCKRLRYALEFVSELYAGATTKMVRTVTTLQDLLGRVQDAAVAVERLESLATAPDAGLAAETVFLMGAVAERYHYEARQVSEELPGHLEDLKGKTWRKLDGVMEKRRLELASLYRWPLHPRGTQADGKAEYEGSSTPQL